MRLIAFYTFWMTVIYTVLPYKTPWCLLNFLYGMILLAGIGAAAVMRWGKSRGWKIGMAVLLVACDLPIWAARPSGKILHLTAARALSRQPQKAPTFTARPRLKFFG